MKKIIILGTFICASIGSLYSQTAYDALRSSENYYSGSARFMSMGGSMGALGGDLSAITVNPAGLGVYRSGEFSITPEFRMYNYSTNAYQQSITDFDYNLKLSQIGFVSGYTRNRDEGLVSLNFGISYNNLADFNNNRQTSVLELPDTRLVDMVAAANQADPSGNNPGRLGDFYEGLAYEAYLINYDTAAMEYWSFPSDNFGQEGELKQDINTTLSSSGFLGEYTIAFGGNYSHKLYFGASIGIQRLTYEEDRMHYEEDYVDSTADFHSMEFIENYNSNGTGANLKLGFIYRPIDFVRLGLAFHSPTVFSLEDTYTADIIANFDNGDQVEANSPEQVSEYNLKTPMRLNASLGFQFRQYGLLNIDYEYVDYTNMTASSDHNSFEMDGLNNDIEAFLKSTHNFRAGAEGRLGSFALRAGYAYYMSNESGDLNSDNNKSLISFGTGYRGESMYIDVGYANLMTGYKELFFGIDEVDYERSLGRLMATVGFRF